MMDIVSWIKRIIDGNGGLGEITIAVANHVIANIDRYVGALYLADKDQYSRCEQALKGGEK